MIDLPRRRMLQAGLAGGASTLLPSIARAAAIAPDRRSGTLEDLQHVVILMQENRAFDHYFGSLPGVRGFGDRFPIPAPPLPGAPARTVWLQPSEDGRQWLAPFALDTAAQFGYMRVQGTPHSWVDAQRAWDHGRLGNWPAAKHNHALGYYRRADIPFQFALADAFTVCDAYHAAIQTGTNSNRVFLWTGGNDPQARAGGPVIGNSHDNFPALGGFAEPYRWTTYVEQLQRAGVSWQIYQDMRDNFTDNPLAGFDVFRQAYSQTPGHDAQLRARGVSTRGVEQLREDVIGGRLPSVSFIIADAAGSEHPDPSSPAQGAAYTARVLDALTADPRVWSRTALLLMFDENDGFFDHMPPPAPPSPDPRAAGGFAGASSIATDDEYHRHPAPGEQKVDLPELRGRPYGLGPRVPLYVLSPWSRGGWVDSQVYDHTSVLRLLERRFGVPCTAITPWRRAVCGDLTAAFDFSRTDTRPFVGTLPDISATATRAAALHQHTLPPLPPTLQPPEQAFGLRRSRAVPYRPRVQLDVVQARGEVVLRMANAGAAAVLHVYDRYDLAAIPRRYTVGADAPLDGTWTTYDGRYDLWVLGPNGFHRHYRGNVGVVPLIADIAQDPDDAQALRLTLHNPGNVPVAVTLQPAAYANAQPREGVTIAPGQHHQRSWSAAATGGWYDLWIEHNGAHQRLAGRVETGADSVSDPAMGGPARLYQDHPVAIGALG
ncbi:phosphocholine-specific phospholipase C [Xanthomonas campestris]|uniref:phosphocholine-specific phospholipase C n=1 Tax=Xanthomonas campestris TaxID=339 RepID=UPI00096E3ABB|nr:phospholipase C, phosphocholine-specific [Xanthomonas campestris]MCF8825575.1 phospholipase C, phosphocholine-specific [Xanthomonas campestris pv. raphani]MEA9838278.1 phospholipase C, phosphocholine-specific [Xanthomonas campestris pv. raphani]MEA9875949.1 phospholipase C, phosphocholine-specific [Xanthomonas campestris pv. raphani]MEA9891013.1 phospholipase C, phosphocholine-specific [Xanthomonas campestris pv. raphani]MEA9932204.1 phospholipase C, phosphocholine-specific [Xanthomonas cam